MTNVIDRAVEKATVGLRAELATSEAKVATAEAAEATAKAGEATAKAAEAKLKDEAAKLKDEAAMLKDEAAKLKDEAAKFHEQTAAALIVLVEQRMDSVPAEVRDRIASASTATLSGWLSDIVLRNNLEALLATGHSSVSGSHATTNGAEEHQDAPVNGAKQPPEPDV